MTACGGGGGGGGSSSGGGTQNTPPIANAGTAQSVTSGVTVTLNGSTSSDPDGTIASYAWTQTVGTTVTLSSATAAQPTFVAPTVVSATTLTFSLVVTDNRGTASTAATVNVTVNPSNLPPIANAGSPQSVLVGTIVSLNGSASGDVDGRVSSYTWTQTAGPSVTLSSTTSATPTFTAPASATSLTFALVVADNRGSASAASNVNITVAALPAGSVIVGGRVRYARPPFSTSFPFGLDYGSPLLMPARGVTVQIRHSTTLAVVTTVVTDPNGYYSIPVAANTSFIQEIVAQIVRESPQALPHWNVSVRDGESAPLPYAYSTGGAFNSGTGITRNIDIPLNINSAGDATGTRASGPFAALDTIYQGIQTVLSASPTSEFPALVVNWGTHDEGTFFSSGNPQHIALLSDLATDTDEFDQHVVAHEFGHYIEHNFSRADNIGGPHGLGDRLDIRVAFGEGFGYAFAAMVLNDPNARDSFRDTSASPQLRSGGFDIEDNPPAPSDQTGCWCSESSVWSVLYDLYDSAADSGDSVELGFGALWQVLTNEQRTTPAFTSIFSFMTALKGLLPAEAPSINTLLTAQNTVAVNMNAFGSTETNLPTGVPTAAVFPLYTTATVGGGPVVLRTVNDAGTTNKIGNHRYVRFNNASQRNVTITLATSNPNSSPDPDFIVWSGLNLIGASTSAPPGPEVRQFNNLPAGDYVIDAYDCANGCNPSEGTPGDYDLTVTITSP